MSASERRRAIIEALCQRRCDTRENLASEFGVAIRTIDYDILALSLDYPIYTVTGKGGGIYVEDGYRLDRKYLSDEQSELLEELLPQLTGKQAEVLQSILKTFKLNKHNRESRK